MLNLKANPYPTSDQNAKSVTHFQTKPNQKTKEANPSKRGMAIKVIQASTSSPPMDEQESRVEHQSTA